MSNTSASFRDKWANNPAAFFAETLREGSDTQQWILRRNGFASLHELRRYLAGVRRILDAGCGNGRVTALLREVTDAGTTEIVGVDANAAPVAQQNLAGVPGVAIRQADLLGDLDALGHFDFIYCQEVLHHTGDAARAFANVARRLAPGGELAIYVYCRKAPIREFADDYVRDRIAKLPYDEAMRVSASITELGRVLSEVPATITVPDVDVLGIRAGEYSIQRFVYHFFLKCYWNPDVSPQENVVVNYDWYHPQDCTRHTLEEVRVWYHTAELSIVHEHVDEYGITVRGRNRRDVAEPSTS